MPTTELNYSEDAQKSLRSGIDQLANAVKTTLGPRGRNVIIQSPNSKPIITKDGVTVAKSIKLKNEQESLGAEIIQGVAIKTAELVGDGTTTATILAQAIISEGMKNVAAGANPMDLKKGMDSMSKQVTDGLETMSKKVIELSPNFSKPYFNCQH